MHRPDKPALLKKAYAANHKLQTPKDKQIPISKSQIRAKANYLLTHRLELFCYFDLFFDKNTEF